MASPACKHVTSLSREQVSRSRSSSSSPNVDEAANDVRDRVARARKKLPEEVEEPVVAKRDADASPIVWLALSGDGHDQIELSTHGRDADRRIGSPSFPASRT